MQASDLAEQVPTVTRSTTGADAAKLVAEYRLTGLVVVDDTGFPTAVLPGSQLLNFIIPQYVRDDPKLAHAFDEKSADEICSGLNDTSVGQLIDHPDVATLEVPRVRPEDTMVEVATLMAQSHFPLILVIGDDNTWHGTILVSRVMAAIAERAGKSSPLVRHRLHADLIERVNDLGLGDDTE